MKLIINYDLLEKIKEANNGIKLEKNIKHELKVQSFLFTIFPLIDLAMLGEVQWLKNLILCSCYFTINVGIKTLVDKIFKERTELIAFAHLIMLASQLNDLNVKTNADLLKESEVYKTEYKLLVNENKLPIITQKKYILVPTYNGLGNITDTSILQEHILGSDEYELSIGSPEKKLVLKPVYNV